MRLLVDYRSALRGRSGVGEYLHRLVAALLARFPSSASPRQLDMTVLSSSWKDRLTLSRELDGVKTVDLRVPVSVLNLAWHRLDWPPVELLAGAAFDVTHSGHPLLLPARDAAQVVTIHDLNFLSHPERTRAEIRRDYPALARAHAHRADAVIVSSRFTAAEVERRLGLSSDRIAVCPPGAPDWPPRPALPDDGYLLFVGTLEPRKNVGALLDAYERLLARRAMPPLVLAGRATAESRLWIDRIGRAPLAGHARHIGYVDPSALRALYEGARVLVQPSFEEGFGFPVLEAMTIGVPVVAADRGALPEVLGDAGLLVDPLQADAMASGLERMLDDTAFASSCAARGAERARGFRWSDTAARVYRVYQLAMERRAERMPGAHRD